jgi:RNA polymerase sigma-70 factor (ECF subfamily)
VDRCLAGDEKAAEALVAALTPMIYAIGHRLTGRPEDAEDLVQEVFLRLFRSLRDFRGDCSLRAWGASIAVNEARSRVGRIVRFRRTFATLDPSPDDDPGEDPMLRLADPSDPGPLERLLGEERSRLVADAIDALPVEFREAVVLRDQQGLAYEEVAAATGVPIGTVRSRLARGRAILATKLRALLGPSREKAGKP